MSYCLTSDSKTDTMYVSVIQGKSEDFVSSVYLASWVFTVLLLWQDLIVYKNIANNFYLIPHHHDVSFN